MKKLTLICLLLGCALLAIGVTQCGGDTSTTTGPIVNGDGGQTSSPPPSGW